MLQRALTSAFFHLQLIQYAKHKGIKTINVVRCDEHIQELKDAGCGCCSTTAKALLE
jgi:hypothetical protein